MTKEAHQKLYSFKSIEFLHKAYSHAGIFNKWNAYLYKGSFIQKHYREIIRKLTHVTDMETGPKCLCYLILVLSNMLKQVPESIY